MTMEYKGKKSKTVYNPRCSFSKNGGNFLETAVFTSKVEAETLIEKWVFVATKHNPDAFVVKRSVYGVDVYGKRDNELLYTFHIYYMNLFD